MASVPDEPSAEVSPPDPSTDRRTQRAGRPEGRGRLLERETQLNQLRPLFSPHWRHPVGPIVIEGRAGIGKTALLGVACSLATEAGWTVLRARGDSYNTKVAYGILDRLLASSPDLHSAPAAGETAERAAALVGSLSDSSGIVIAIDDVQWADDATLDWLATICTWPTSRSIRLILTLGARDPGRSLKSLRQLISDPSTHLLSPRRLSPKAIGQLATEFFGEAPSAEFVDACDGASGGVPFLLLALFREVEAAGVGAKDAETVRTATSPLVARSVLAQLLPLPSDANRVLEVVAAADGPIDLEVAAEACDLDVPAAGRMADALSAVNVLERGRPLRFREEFVRRTMCAQIPPTLLAETHQRIARSLRERGAPSTQVAEHLLRAEPHGEDWVADDLAIAGSLVLGQGDHERAARYLSRALAERPVTLARPAILIDLARAEAPLDSKAALAHLTLALEQGARDKQAVKTAVRIARTAPVEVESDIEAVLARVGDLLSDIDVDAKIDVAVATALLRRSALSAISTATFLRSLLAEQRYPPSRSEREGLALLAVLSSGSVLRTGSDDIVSIVRRAIPGSDLVADDHLTSELFGQAIFALAAAGECKEAVALGRGAQTAARECSHAIAEANYSLALARSLRLQGSLQEAEEEVARAFLVAEPQSWRGEGEAAAIAAGLLIDEGRYDDAEDRLARAAERPESTITPRVRQALLEESGRLNARRGRHSEALGDLFAAGRLAQEYGTDSPVLSSWRSEASLLLAADGRRKEAAQLAEENLEFARLHGAKWVVGSALHLLGMTGETADRTARLEEAVAALTESGAQLCLAGAMIDLGRTLRETGSDLPAAREVLRSAADVAFRSGATPLVSLAATELRLAGARPRRLALRGTDSLTDAERRVVALAAQGYTNGQIAHTLYLSEKTIESHLGRSFRKLGIRSRRELESFEELRQDA